MWGRTYGPDEADFQKLFPALRDALYHLIGRGGGVMILGPAGQTVFIALRPFTEPWGARLLHETIKDSAGHKEYLLEWAYTAHVPGRTRFVVSLRRRPRLRVCRKMMVPPGG